MENTNDKQLKKKKKLRRSATFKDAVGEEKKKWNKK